MGLLIAVGIIALVAILPLGFRLRYNGDGFVIGLILGPVIVGLYPRKRSAIKQKTAPTADRKKSQNSEGTSSKGGSISDFRDVIGRVLDFVKDFQRKLVIRNLKLRLTLAGGDPSDLACNYGRAWAALGGLQSLLEQAFTIRNNDLSVNCDFTADQTLVYFYGDVVIPLYRFIKLLGVHGVKILRSYLKLKKLRKGGNVS